GRERSAELVREDGEELVLRTVGRLGVRARLLRLRVQPGVLARQLLGLGARGPLPDERPALADVADRAGDQHPLLGLERAQTDLHRELRAVSPQPVELEARPHGAHPRLLEVGEAVLRVVAAEALGDEHLHGLAEELVPAIAEQSLRLRVHQDDPSRALDHDHRVGSRLQEPAELPLDLLAVRDVADDARDDHPVPSLERGEADLGRELAAVLAAAGVASDGRSRVPARAAGGGSEALRARGFELRGVRPMPPPPPSRGSSYYAFRSIAWSEVSGTARVLHRPRKCAVPAFTGLASGL